MASLGKNIALLYILQAANFLIPMVTVPYLTRVLGVTDFGRMGLATGLIGIMTMVTDWGFSLTATQSVARNAGDPAALRRLFWAVFWARVCLGIACFVGLAAAIVFMPSLRELTPVILAASVQVLAAMFSVNWFLQGLERMGAYVWTFLLGRVLSIPLTFLLVQGPGDAAMAVLVPGVCALLSCGISFRESNRHVALLPIRLDRAGMIEQLRDGAKIFVSTGAINLYTQSTILLLGALTNKTEVGLYYGSDRIRRAVQALIGPAGAALFPRINNLLSHDRGAARDMMIRMLLVQGSFTLVMFVVAPWGVPLFLGKDYVGAVKVVQWMSPLPFVIGISNVLGVNVMLPLGMKNQFALIVSMSAIVNLVAMLLLCPSFGAVGAALSSLITECFVTATMGAVLCLRGSTRQRSA
jgi:O-antigen/teichoic acid export membrane protein